MQSGLPREHRDESDEESDELTSYEQGSSVIKAKRDVNSLSASW